MVVGDVGSEEMPGMLNICMDAIDAAAGRLDRLTDVEGSPVAPGEMGGAGGRGGGNVAHCLLVAVLVVHIYISTSGHATSHVQTR